MTSMYCGGHGLSLPCAECARNLAARRRRDARSLQDALSAAHDKANARRFTDSRPSAFGQILADHKEALALELDRVEIDLAALEEDAPATFEERAEWLRENEIDMRWKDERGES